jgi:phytoene synthase
MSLSLVASRRWCCRRARRTAANFYFSFLTLPRQQRVDMCVLYAFMRTTDDLGDNPQLPADQRLRALCGWEHDVVSALQSGPTEHACLPALAELVSRYGIPHEHLKAVINGVRMDQQTVRFATFDELQDYAFHVAGAVGLCCIHIWGFSDQRAIDRAIECGLAFQLTNILRDLAEDVDDDRIYLPQADLETFGYTHEDLAARRYNHSFRRLMKFEVDRARSYYDRSSELLKYLAPTAHPVLKSMLRIYGELLTEIEKRDYDVFQSRIRLPTWQKLMISADEIFRNRGRPGLRND